MHSTGHRPTQRDGAVCPCGPGSIAGGPERGGGGCTRPPGTSEGERHVRRGGTTRFSAKTLLCGSLAPPQPFARPDYRAAHRLRRKCQSQAAGSPSMAGPMTRSALEADPACASGALLQLLQLLVRQVQPQALQPRGIPQPLQLPQPLQPHGVALDVQRQVPQPLGAAQPAQGPPRPRPRCRCCTAAARGSAEAGGAADGKQRESVTGEGPGPCPQLLDGGKDCPRTTAVPPPPQCSTGMVVPDPPVRARTGSSGAIVRVPSGAICCWRGRARGSRGRLLHEPDGRGRGAAALQRVSTEWDAVLRPILLTDRKPSDGALAGASRPSHSGTHRWGVGQGNPHDHEMIPTAPEHRMHIRFVIMGGTFAVVNIRQLLSDTGAAKTFNSIERVYSRAIAFSDRRCSVPIESSLLNHCYVQ